MRLLHFQACTASQASKLIDCAEPQLTPALVQYGSRRVPDSELRTGMSVRMTDNHGADIAEIIRKRIAFVLGCSAENVEPLWVLRYREGEFFGPHVDGSERFATAVVTLHGDCVGGETDFPDRGVSVAPGEAGSGFIFSDSVSKFGELHASLPVRFGEKWVAVTWIRGFKS